MEWQWLYKTVTPYSGNSYSGHSVRPHRMHDMQTIATDDCSVCQFVCHAAQLGFTVQKRLNGSTSCLWGILLGTLGTLCYTGVLITQHQGGKWGKILPIVDPLPYISHK